MERCARCSAVVEADWSYCPVCDRSRILESLRVPVVPTETHNQIFRKGMVLLAAWLVVTLAVAAFREFKDVRDSERFYAAGHIEESWRVIVPFVQIHPEHVKALLLCGKSSVRMAAYKDAKQCLDWLVNSPPELREELEKDYAQIIAGQARGLGCDPDGVQNLLDGAEMLGGSSLVDSVTSGLDVVVEACRVSKQQWPLARITEILVERKRGMDMINRGYAPVIRKAVAEGLQSDARWLAYQARSEVPDGAGVVKDALNGKD